MKEFLAKTYSDKDPALHVVHVLHCRIEPKHTHDFIEIVYTSKGVMDQIVNGKHFKTKKGDLLFINYNSVHSFRPVGDASYYNICFYPETLGNFITQDNAFALLSLSAFSKISKESNEGIVSFLAKEQKSIVGIFDEMLREQNERQSRFDVINESYMNILITMIIRKTDLPESEGQDTWTQLAGYIEQNLDSDLSLSSLAKKCFYNPSYFCRVFKDKFGTNLVDYVNRKRVERAIELLTTTELSIESISNSIGFSGKSVFYRTFSKITGKTPAEYRSKP